MGTLAVAHPCSPLLVQCGLPWESRPAIVPEPEVTLRRRFQDSPEPPQPGMVPPGAAPKVMQTSVRMGATTVLASDGPCGGRPSVQGFALSLTVPDEATGESLCAALADGGQVHLPLTTTCFVRASAWSLTASACHRW